MAIDAFLQFSKPGAAATAIDGETQDAHFKKMSPPPFEIQNWSFGAANASTIGSATMGAGAGKASFEPFKVTKNIDRASPSLFKTCCVGGHYDELTLWVRKTGGAKEASGDAYLEWKFKMAFVQNLAWTNADPLPTEDVTFVYGAIQFEYRPQSADGSVKPGTPVAWSQVQNSDEFAVTSE